MRALTAGLLVVVTLGSPAVATREPTVPPVYYLIDYGREHLDNPEYIEWIRELPPELLHFGKDVPMTHLYGPIAAVGGENQAHGRNRDDIRRLTPDEVRERIAALQRMNTALHEAGVKTVMPYTSAITYAGHPETREGLFDFYDHWGEYAEFGIGPRPRTDPVEWIALRADGRRHTFGKEEMPAYYAGLHRYVACIEHPDWRSWLVQVHRLVALAGYDGAFPDNSSPIQCYGPHCQEGFSKHLAEKFTADQLEELFGTRDARQIKLPTEREGLLWVEAQRFWRMSLARHLHELREGGRQENPDFLLFPNCGAPIYSAEFLAGHVDYMMFEGGRGPQGAGCLVKRIIGDITRRTVMDDILDYRYVADVPGDIRPMLLKLGKTPSAQKLCLAEAAAFGSGAYNGVRPGTRDVQRPYLEFLLKYKDLYEGKVSASRVAMLYFPMRASYPGSRHCAAALNLKGRLGSLQIPFDCFSEAGLELGILRTYEVCIAPELKYLSREHLDILGRYLEGGGRLVVIGDFATHDELCRPQPARDWLPEPAGERKVGEGTIARRELMPTGSEMLELLAPAGEMRLVVEEGKLGRPMLRVMAYQSPGEVIVHLLNYSCPVEAVGAEAIAEDNVPVRVPLREGASVKSVTCMDPEAEDVSPEFEVREGACWFTVPQVPIYVVCRLELA